jgi:hypothetical protein
MNPRTAFALIVWFLAGLALAMLAIVISIGAFAATTALTSDGGICHRLSPVLITPPGPAVQPADRQVSHGLGREAR